MQRIILDFFNLLIPILEIAILVRIILSWFDQGGTTVGTRIVRDMTEPILMPIRKIIPSVGMFDLSPLIALLLLQLIQTMVGSAM